MWVCQCGHTVCVRALSARVWLLCCAQTSSLFDDNDDSSDDTADHTPENETAVATPLSSKPKPKAQPKAKPSSLFDLGDDSDEDLFS